MAKLGHRLTQTNCNGTLSIDYRGNLPFFLRIRDADMVDDAILSQSDWSLGEASPPLNIPLRGDLGEHVMVN